MDMFRRIRFITLALHTNFFYSKQNDEKNADVTTNYFLYTRGNFITRSMTTRRCGGVFIKVCIKLIRYSC